MAVRPLTLRGSCHCRAVRFTVRSRVYYPYQLCYCSICRKTQGGGGYAINLSGESSTLKVTGKRFLSVYRAKIGKSRSTGQRHFCSRCGSALWLYDPTWPELLHPFASAIDTKLPKAPQKTHLMLHFKPSWVEAPASRDDKKFPRYPKESIADWHRRHFGAQK